MALPADARNMKVKARLPVPSIATSGRWNKRSDGEWGFDLDDLPSNDDSSQVDALSAAAASGNLKADLASDDDDDLDQGTISKEVSTHGSINNNNNIPINSSQSLSNNMQSKQSSNPTPKESGKKNMWLYFPKPLIPVICIHFS